MKNTFLSLCSLITFAAAAPAAHAGAIDCSKARDKLDQLICSSDALKAEDQHMAELFAQARTSAFGKGISGQVAAQRAWLAEHGACLKPQEAKPADCLLKQHQARNVALAFAALPIAPNLALPVLREANAQAAPAYEALSLFVSEPEGSDWSKPALAAKRSQILALAAPTVTAVQNGEPNDDPNRHFASELLADAEITTPEDVLKDDKHFTGFIRAATWGLGVDPTLPCAYVISHPSLRAATEPFFGATPDAGMIRTDCAVMVPPSPQFNKLQQQITAGWPQCDGTIRFAAYRSYDVAVDEALAPAAREIADFTAAKAAPKLPRRKGVRASTMQAAIAELKNSYVKNLGAAPAQAVSFAQAKIAKILELAQQCE